MCRRNLGRPPRQSMLLAAAAVLLLAGRGPELVRGIRVQAGLEMDGLDGSTMEGTMLLRPQRLPDVSPDAASREVPQLASTNVTSHRVALEGPRDDWGVHVAAALLHVASAFGTDGRSGEAAKRALTTCSASSFSEAMHALRQRSDAEDRGGGCLAVQGQVVGCKSSCSCGSFQQCYPKPVCAAGVNVGTCGAAVHMLVFYSGLLFLFMLGLIVTIRMCFQMLEEKQGFPQARQGAADLSRRLHKGLSSRSLPVTEWPKIDEDEDDESPTAAVAEPSAPATAAPAPQDEQSVPSTARGSVTSGETEAETDSGADASDDTPEKQAMRLAKKQGKSAF